MLPSPGRMPAVVANQTGVPAGSVGVGRVSTPTPCTPGTYGSSGSPK